MLLYENNPLKARLGHCLTYSSTEQKGYSPIMLGA